MADIEKSPFPFPIGTKKKKTFKTSDKITSWCLSSFP